MSTPNSSVSIGTMKMPLAMPSTPPKALAAKAAVKSQRVVERSGKTLVNRNPVEHKGAVVAVGATRRVKHTQRLITAYRTIAAPMKKPAPGAGHCSKQRKLLRSDVDHTFKR